MRAPIGSPSQLRRQTKRRTLTAAAVVPLLLAASFGCAAESDAQPTNGDTGSINEENATDEDTGTDSTEVDESSGDPVGTLTIGDNSYELVDSHWCDIEEGFDSDWITVRVAAQSEDRSAAISAYEATWDDPDRSALQVMSAIDTVDGESHTYRSGDLNDYNEGWPFLIVDGTSVSIEAELGRGADRYDVVAQFTVPDEPADPRDC